MTPDTLLLLSGGIDSAYCMWRALLEGRTLLVHHVHLTNREGRVAYEAQAVQRILDWMRGKGLDRVVYSDSAFDYGTVRHIVRDHGIWALWIGILLSDPKHRQIRHVIRPDHYDSARDGPDGAEMQRAHRRYRNISFEVCERELVFEHPIQHMMKAEVVQAMPPDLLELCWYCRWPTRDGKPCHRCYTCKLVDPALRGGRLMFEAKVIHPFRCKFQKRNYDVGDVYRHRDKARMEYLASLPTPRVEWPPKAPESTGESEGQSAPVEPKHVGGGWYELPDGSRIKGKQAALAAVGGAGR